MVNQLHAQTPEAARLPLATKCVSVPVPDDMSENERRSAATGSWEAAGLINGTAWNYSVIQHAYAFQTSPSSSHLWLALRKSLKILRYPRAYTQAFQMSPSRKSYLWSWNASSLPRVIFTIPEHCTSQGELTRETTPTGCDRQNFACPESQGHLAKGTCILICQWATPLLPSFNDLFLPVANVDLASAS